MMYNITIKDESEVVLMKHFMVICHRGHCGTGHSTEIKFVFIANNAIEAMDKARKMPSVKHTRLAIAVKEITANEYNEYRQISAYDRFNQTSISTKKKRGRR